MSINAPGVGGGMNDCTPPGIHYKVPKERNPRPIDPFHIPGKKASKDRGRKTDPRNMVVPVPSPANAEKREVSAPVNDLFARVQDFAKMPSPRVSDAQRRVERRVRSALDPKYAGDYFELDSGASVPTVREQEIEEARLEAEMWETIGGGEIRPERLSKGKTSRTDLIGEIMDEMLDGLGGGKDVHPDILKRLISRRIRGAVSRNFEGRHKHPIYRALSDVKIRRPKGCASEEFGTIMPFESRRPPLSEMMIRDSVKAALRRVDEEKRRKKYRRNEARRIKENMSASQFEESDKRDPTLVAKLAAVDNEQRLKDLYPEAHDPNVQQNYLENELLGRYPEAVNRNLLLRKRAEARARKMEELLKTYPEMLVQDPPAESEEAAPEEYFVDLGTDEVLSIEPMKNRREYQVRVA